MFIKHIYTKYFSEKYQIVFLYIYTGTYKEKANDENIYILVFYIIYIHLNWFNLILNIEGENCVFLI
jgi:hypothetical protein